MISPYEFKCRDCGKVKTYQLDTDKFIQWKTGGLIQNLFPEIEDREIMISGTCSDCFDKLFAENEEELDTFEDEDEDEDADDWEEDVGAGGA